MIKKISAFIIIVFISFTAPAQEFTSQWKKVYQLELDGKTKSAYEAVLKIHKLALRQKNDTQQVKSFIYLSNLKNTLFENAEIDFFTAIQAEIKNSSETGKAFLYQYYATQLLDYYNDDYRIRYRANMTDRNATDMAVWDAKKFEAEIQANFEKSFANKAHLSALKVSNYNTLITPVSPYFEDTTKTLYQFFIENYIHALQKFRSFQYYDDMQCLTSYFSNSETFIAANFSSIENETFRKIVEVYQLLEKSTEAQPSLYTIDRLRFLFSYCHNASEKIKQLEKLKTDFQNSKYNNDFQLFYAETLVNLSNKTEFKDNISTAYPIVNQLLANKTNPKIYTEAFNLKETILAKRLHVKMKNEVYPNENLRAFISYKNIDTVSVSYYKINQQLLGTFQSDSLVLAYMNSHTAEKAFFKTLTKKNDFLEHTTELLLEPVTSGNYLVVIGTPKNNGNYSFSYTVLQCNALDYFKEERNTIEHFYFRDRKTGQPISNVIVRTKEKAYLSDENGKFSIAQPILSDKNEDRNCELTIIHENDTLVTYIPYSHADYSDYEINDFTAKAQVYFDRAIYRPGQKLFYKGIITQEKDFQKSVVPFVTVKVVLNNPNREEVQFVEVQTNEFGSFSGEFTIPATGVTGEYDLEIMEPDTYEKDIKYYNKEADEHRFWEDVNFETGSFNFNVEEYKRPTFEVKMDKIATDWQLGDTIILKGKAIGLAGNTIADATVTAEINWYNSQNNYKDKAFVFDDYSTKTATDGTFEIEIPTQKINITDSIYQCNFNLDITVVDSTGETKTATQNVVVSNEMFMLTLNSPYQLLQENKKEITIGAKTFNGVKKQIKGKLEIYKIQSKNNIFSRKFGKPEIETIDSLAFAKLFPFETYNGYETPKKEWVKTIDFDTFSAAAIPLDFLPLGDYELKAIAIDDKKNKIEATKSLRITTKLPHTTLDKMFRYFVKTSENTNTVEVVLTSKIPALYVTCFEYDQKGKIAKEHIITLQNGVGKILFPKPQNRLGLYFFAFYEDHFHSEQHTSFYNKNTNKLQFEILSMRNKMEPGSTENWQFKVLNSKLEAEILASMYDASLDAFGKLDWKIFEDEVSHIYFPYYHKDYYDENEFNFNEFDNQKIDFSFTTAPQLNWFHTEDAAAKLEVLQKKKKKHSIAGNIIALNEIPTPISITNIRNKKSTTTDFYGNFSIEGVENDVLEIENNATVYLIKSALLHNSSIHLGKQNTIQKEIALVSSFEFYKSKPILISQLKRIVFESNFGYKNVLQSNYKTIKGKTLSEYDKFMYENYYSVGSDRKPDYGIENVSQEFMVVDSSYVGFANEEIVDYNQVYTSANGVANEYITEKSYSTNAIEAVVVQSYLAKTKSPNAQMLTALQGRISGVSINAKITNEVVIRGIGSLSPSAKLLYIIDGIAVTEKEFQQLHEDEIETIEIIKDAMAISLYGSKGANGVVVVTTQKAMQELANVKARKNFNETAFFKPHIKTDAAGKFALEFTTPESLIKWHFQMLAHTKMAENEIFSSEIVTQKDLMVLPNMPRFVRENDELVVTAKVANLVNETKTGIAKLSLFDAGTGNPIAILVNSKEIQNFTCKAKGSTIVQWKIKIPTHIQGLHYKIVAKTGNFTDGEENILPVLSNAVLLTESQPVWLQANDTKTVTFAALTNPSATKENHKISINLVSNPIWSVIEALPYLMEYEHDCAEQTFSKLFANTLSEKIINNHPKIKLLLENWKQHPSSKLKMNEELQSVLLSETPWLLENNAEMQKRITALLDVAKLKTTSAILFKKLKEKQSANGGFSWFGVGNENEYITRHILSGIGHLTKLNPESETQYKEIVTKGIAYLDSKLEILKNNRNENSQLHTLYARSFFLQSHPLTKTQDSIIKLELDTYKKNWLQQSLYQKTILALVLHRFDDKSFAKKIMEHLRESKIIDPTKGMFWAANTNGYYWYQCNIELQALLIEAFAEIDYKEKEIEAMKVWLINNKQNKNWNSTKSTALAINAIVSYGKDWLARDSKIIINDGKNAALQQQLQSKLKETENGLLHLEIKKEAISKDFTGVKLENKGVAPIYGGVFYQYFENLDKIEATKNLNYSISKEILKDEKLVTTNQFKVGDLLTIRLTFTTEKDLEFVHVKDLRASCLEPVAVFSETKWINSTHYYMSTKDVATHFFFDYLPKGTYVLDYKVRVNNEGEFSDGYANMQSMYAPEFSAHSNSGKISASK